MDKFDTPYDMYQARGYSAKQTFAAVFAGGSILGVVLTIGFIVVKLVTAVDKSTLELFAVIFISILLALFALAGALGLVTIFRFIQKPGIQMPGILGRLEEKFEDK